MVNKSKNIEVNEITKPNIINGLDLTFSSSLRLFLEDAKLLFLLERRFGKGFNHDKFEIYANYPKVLNKSLW